MHLQFMIKLTIRRFLYVIGIVFISAVVRMFGNNNLCTFALLTINDEDRRTLRETFRPDFGDLSG